MAKTELAVEMELTSAVVVRPGDTLIVATPRTLSMDQIDRWRAVMRERLPGVDVMVVEAQQLAVYRPDGG